VIGILSLVLWKTGLIEAGLDRYAAVTIDFLRFIFT
jgi:hypothetical protein